MKTHTKSPNLDIQLFFALLESHKSLNLSMKETCESSISACKDIIEISRRQIANYQERKAASTSYELKEFYDERMKYDIANIAEQEQKISALEVKIADSENAIQKDALAQKSYCIPQIFESISRSEINTLIKNSAGQLTEESLRSCIFNITNPDHPDIQDGLMREFMSEFTQKESVRNFLDLETKFFVNILNKCNQNKDTTFFDKLEEFDFNDDLINPDSRKVINYLHKGHSYTSSHFIRSKTPYVLVKPERAEYTKLEENKLYLIMNHHHWYMVLKDKGNIYVIDPHRHLQEKFKFWIGGSKIKYISLSIQESVHKVINAETKVSDSVKNLEVIGLCGKICLAINDALSEKESVHIEDILDIKTKLINDGNFFHSMMEKIVALMQEDNFAIIEPTEHGIVENIASIIIKDHEYFCQSMRNPPEDMMIPEYSPLNDLYDMAQDIIGATESIMGACIIS